MTAWGDKHEAREEKPRKSDTRKVDAPPEGALMGFDPRLDVREPVVALGEDEGQPYNGRPAEAQALPIAISREVLVQ